MSDMDEPDMAETVIRSLPTKLVDICWSVLGVLYMLTLIGILAIGLRLVWLME